MKKIIIHLGQYKTGSTSIQNMMWEYREELLKHGVLYPQSLTRDGAHFGITDLLRKEFWNPEEHADLFPLREEIEQTKANNIVISCETLSGATLRWFSAEMMEYMWRRLVELFHGFNVRVVFYARRQDDSIDSRIIQEIKGRGRQSMINHEPFLYERSSLNYHYFCSMLEKSFCKGNVDVRVFDRKYLIGSDVRYDFLDYLGVSADSITVPELEENVSPSPKLIAMCRVINSMNLTSEYYSSMNDSLWKEFGALNDGSKAVVLGSEQREQVMEYYRESNVRFVQDYVRDEDKESFEDVLFRASKDVESNVFIDGFEVMRFFKDKGFVLSKSG